MKYRFLGNTGIKASEICLGTMNFGSVVPDQESVNAILDIFASSGGNFIDTADVYVGGKSEEMLGSWLATQRRENFVIATKVMFGGPGPNDSGLSRKHIISSLESSLQRLQTNYVDVYQVHSWDAQTPVEAWLGTMQMLLQSGKIQSVGVSNVTGWQLQKIIGTAKSLGVPIASIQMQYNLLCRQPELEVLDCALNEGVSVLCWSPLKGGWLSGKFKKDEAPDTDTRVGKVEAGKVPKLQSNPSYSQFASNDNIWALLATLTELSDADRSVAQVSVRWLLQRPGVSSVVIGREEACVVLASVLDFVCDCLNRVHVVHLLLLRS